MKGTRWQPSTWLNNEQLRRCRLNYIASLHLFSPTFTPKTLGERKRTIVFNDGHHWNYNSCLCRGLFSAATEQEEWKVPLTKGLIVESSDDVELNKFLNWLDRVGILDFDTCASLLRWCGNERAVLEGKLVHDHMINSGFDQNPFLKSLLVQMYSKCGAPTEALSLFTTMQERHVFSYNFIISAYAREEQGCKALRFFDQMQQEGVIPDKFTFTSIFYACAVQAALLEGEQIHARIIDSGFESDLTVGTALINMYGKCSGPKEALHAFEILHERDVVAWTAMITVYAQHGQAKDAIQLFYQMQQQGEMPNRVTFVSMLSTCASKGVQIEGKQMHARIRNSSSDSDVVIWNSLINMYAKCGTLEYARMLFHETIKHDVISWNCMIAACIEQGEAKEAIMLFYDMQQESVMPDKVTVVTILDACSEHQILAEGMKMHARTPDGRLGQDVIIGNALVKMYGKCGSLEVAWTIFERMPQQNVISWSLMIGLHVYHAQCTKALQLADQMLQGVGPNKITFICILSAFSFPSELTKAKWMHGCILDRGFESDVVVANALITMYGRCGSLEDAQNMFTRMHQQNVISWTAMIVVYVQHGYYYKPLKLFYQMQWEGVKPNRVTFICVISACASQAALAEGKKIHAGIVNSGYEMDPVVTTALVNMYGKCGCINDARMVFDKILDQDVILWNALIALYAQHGHSKEVFQLTNQMQEEGKMPDKVTFISVLAVCSHAGLINEGCHLFTAMKQDYGILLALDHYVCIIDSLGRAGLLDEAEYLIPEIPCQSTAVPFVTLLCACIYQGDVERGERVANHLFHLDPENAAPYALLSNIYTNAGREDDAATNIMKDKGLKLDDCSGYGVLAKCQSILSQEDVYFELQSLRWLFKEPYSFSL